MTAPLPALLALRDAVQECQGPDRELDARIATVVFDIRPPVIWIVGDEEPIFFDEPLYKQEAPHYTSSIDASERLRMALLPKSSIDVVVDARAHVTLYLAPDAPWCADERVQPFFGLHPVESIARTLAVLNALIGKERE